MRSILIAQPLNVAIKGARAVRGSREWKIQSCRQGGALQELAGQFHITVTINRYVIIAFHFPKLDNAGHLFVQPAPVTPEYEVTPPGDSFYDWGGRSVHFLLCSAGEFKYVYFILLIFVH